MFQKGKLNFKKFLISLLSALMAVMLAFSVACDTTDDDDDTSDSSSSSSTTSEITDYQLIKNGDFEFGSTDKTTYPLSSSINWSKSMGSDVTVAPSSKGSSGIIDTEDTAFSKLSEKNKARLYISCNIIIPMYICLIVYVNIFLKTSAVTMKSHSSFLYLHKCTSNENAILDYIIYIF